MSAFKISFLALAASALAFQSLPMSGQQTGQLRVYRWSDKTEAGCLTDDGSWTKDEGACGSFTAKDDGPVYVDRTFEKVLLSTRAGGCWLDDDLNFACASDITDSLWIHYPDFDNNFLLHSRSLDGFNAADGYDVPEDEEQVPFRSTLSQSWDNSGDYQLYWKEQ